MNGTFGSDSGRGLPIYYGIFEQIGVVCFGYLYPCSDSSTISHEVAHFWWNKASDGTWEDWLNEGFAEFSTLLFIQKLISDSTYLDEVKNYNEMSKKVAPVWEMDRNGNSASMILYRKAPVALVNFRNTIGDEAFFNLLKSIHQNKINNTAALLKLIEKIISSEAKNNLIDLLKN